MKKALFISMATALLLVMGQVAHACTISTSPLSFGMYFPSQPSPLFMDSVVSVNCPIDTIFSITLDDGLNFSSPDRRATAGGNFIRYQLYKDATYSIIWDTLSPVNGTGIASPQNYLVYGMVFGGQNIPPGTYTDTVVSTVSW